MRFRVGYLVCVFACFLTVFAVEFVVFGGLAVLLGSKQDVAEHMETLSVPLGYFSRAFIIRPDKSFLDVCGILLGNSFLYGLPLYICVTVVRSVLQRSRVTQINIAGSRDITDDD